MSRGGRLPAQANGRANREAQNNYVLATKEVQQQKTNSLVTQHAVGNRTQTASGTHQTPDQASGSASAERVQQAAADATITAPALTLGAAWGEDVDADHEVDVSGEDVVETEEGEEVEEEDMEETEEEGDAEAGGSSGGGGGGGEGQKGAHLRWHPEMSAVRVVPGEEPWGTQRSGRLLRHAEVSAIRVLGAKGTVAKGGL